MRKQNEELPEDEARVFLEPSESMVRKDNLYSLDLMNHHKTKLTVRVRLDVNGDGTFIIPYETAFDDDVDTTSDKEESTWDAVKGFFGQKKEDETAQRWLIHSDLYDKPRNRVHDGNPRFIYDEKTTGF